MKLASLFASIIALSGIFSLGPARSQTFSKVAPRPTGADLWGVWFTSPTDGWVAGLRHTLLRTRDHGVTWTEVGIPGYSTEPLYDVTFVDSQLGFVSGNSADTGQDIYRTSNGGATWQPIANFPLGGSWYHIQFVSSTTGFMGANGGLVRSTDGGMNWSLRSSYPDCPIIYGMRFRDANNGIACGYQASSGADGIFKTSDGGATWSLKYAGYSNSVTYMNSTTLLADSGDSVVRSIDGGETWSPVATVSTGFMGLAKVDVTTAVGVSTGGDVWRSTDGGFTWSLRKKGVSDLPSVWRVRFQDSLNGHVVGQGGSIFETTDGGSTWTTLSRGISADWNAAVAFADDNVLLVGLHGYVQSTADAGNHWTPQIIDPPVFGRDTSISGVSQTGPDSAVAIGHWGSLFKTSDRGATWTNLSDRLNPSYYANGVKFTDANNGWIVGWDYNTGPKSYVRRTTDGGLTWQTVDAVNVPSMRVDFMGQNGWIMTDGAAFYRTTNGGASWSLVALPLSAGVSPDCMGMSWGTSSVGYICGFDGYLIKSTNGGASWTPTGQTQYGFVLLDVIARGADEVWICGATSGGGNAMVKRSMDGGATWQSWSLPGDYTTPYRMVQTASHVYVCGYGGDVWRFDVTAPLPILTGLTVSPSTVVGGKTSAGTVTINSAAPAGGFTIQLSSSRSEATVPANVQIPEGQTQSTFTISTTPVTTNTIVSVSASAGSVTKTASLTIAKTDISKIALKPSTQTGGKTAIATVTLNGPAPVGGKVVTLASDRVEATVPASIIVPEGQSTATFTIDTAAVAVSTIAKISATVSSTKTANLTIKPPVVSALSLSPSTVKGGANSTGTVTLTGIAPAGGTSVALSSDRSEATVPATVTVPAGQKSVQLTIKTTAVTAITNAMLTAATGTVSKSKLLTISP